MKRLVILGLSCLALVAGANPGQGAEAVTEVELEAFAQRLAAVRKVHLLQAEQIEEDLEKAKEALQVEMVKKAARPWLLAYLRCVMMLEEDLRLLAAPEDKVKGDPDSREFSTQEKKKVAALRQEIRDGERKRIRAELKEGRAPHSNEKTEERLLKDEQALDSLYDRNTSKLKRDIARAERDLSKEKFSDRRDDRKVEALAENLKQWRRELRKVHHYVYGFEPGWGFELPVTDGESPVGKLLAVLVAERDRLRKILRGEEEEDDEGEKKGGVVGGSFLYSSNLGVVLDISGSMTSHIEPLKKEIAETFEVPRYREFQGCRIVGSQFWQMEDMGLRKVGMDTASIMEELIAVYGVDTVYWFCDLRDEIDATGLRRLRFLLKRGGSAFHVKSMALGPSRELKPLIDDFQD